MIPGVDFGTVMDILPVVWVVVKMRFVSPSGLTSKTWTLYLRPGRRFSMFTDVVVLGRSVEKKGNYEVNTIFGIINVAFLAQNQAKNEFSSWSFSSHCCPFEHYYFTYSFWTSCMSPKILTNHILWGSFLREFILHSKSRHCLRCRYPGDDEAAGSDFSNGLWGVHCWWKLAGLTLCFFHCRNGICWIKFSCFISIAIFLIPKEKNWT